VILLMKNMRMESAARLCMKSLIPNRGANLASVFDQRQHCHDRKDTFWLFPLLLLSVLPKTSVSDLLALFNKVIKTRMLKVVRHSSFPPK